ncbi:unnamed protein product [Soboliphyme baturini]|uniref:AGC-kinase C-terminal domain-containing protein n=1 Tax=Soboliphyme baturini TaxID=241478 RepID=A0A183J887_9BILA|nr:unnamed protein product [Soboliphyme baturini]
MKPPKPKRSVAHHAMTTASYDDSGGDTAMSSFSSDFDRLCDPNFYLGFTADEEAISAETSAGDGLQEPVQTSPTDVVAATASHRQQPPFEDAQVEIEGEDNEGVKKSWPTSTSHNNDGAASFENGAGGGGDSHNTSATAMSSAAAPLTQSRSYRFVELRPSASADSHQLDRSYHAVSAASVKPTNANFAADFTDPTDRNAIVATGRYSRGDADDG